MNSASDPKLEIDLEQARRHGRWLSDDEQASLEAQERQRQQLLATQQLHRGKLLLLLAVSVVIPPLWPLALAICLYLLFPVSTKRFALTAGVTLLVIGMALAALITALLVALLVALF